MLYIQTATASYESIRQSLDEVFPQAVTTYISTDTALKSLGFADAPPCVFSLDMTWSEFDDMMEALEQLEVDAFNTPDGLAPAETDEDYQRYLAHGWLWDLFYNARRKDNITEEM